MIVLTGGAILLNPFAMVLFSVCSAVTVECFVPVLHGCVWYVCCYVGKKALLQCLFLFGEIIRNMFWCVCYFVVECDGVVECGWRCSIG